MVLKTFCLQADRKQGHLHPRALTGNLFCHRYVIGRSSLCVSEGNGVVSQHIFVSSFICDVDRLTRWKFRAGVDMCHYN